MSVPNSIIERVRDFYEAKFQDDPEATTTYTGVVIRTGIAGGEVQAAINVLQQRGELELVRLETPNGNYTAYRFHGLEQERRDTLAETRAAVTPRGRLSPLAERLSGRQLTTSGATFTR